MRLPSSSAPTLVPPHRRADDPALREDAAAFDLPPSLERLIALLVSR